MARRNFAGGYLVISGRALADLLRSRNGPVAREIIEAIAIVKRGAKARVGKDSGELDAAIVSRLVTDPKWGVAGIVIAEKDYALFHHEGTVPHPIDGAPLLAFEITPGEVVIVSHVDHPGTKANRFLTDAFADLKRRY